MSSKNNEDEVRFIHKARRWRRSYWLAIATLVVLWGYAVYEVVGYVVRS
jgi:hypothetical protein